MAASQASLSPCDGDCTPISPIAEPCSPSSSNVVWRDSDGATISYSFNAALFQNSFYFFFHGGIFTRGLALYVICIILATLLAALCACNGPGDTSHLLGSRGCWRNNYNAGWGDLTLNALTAFLLGLLVNNVLQRWWTTRLMVQDATNTAAQVLFVLASSMRPRQGRSAAELQMRDALMDNIVRRLKLAFRILLQSAKTDYTKDRGGQTVGGLQARRDRVAWEVANYFKGLLEPKAGGRGALLLREEYLALNGRRHAYQVLAWVVRDAQTLIEGKHVADARYGDVLSSVGKLRGLCEDVPMFTRVQLPFVTVALVVRGIAPARPLPPPPPPFTPYTPPPPPLRITLQIRRWWSTSPFPSSCTRPPPTLQWASTGRKTG
jgi:hypothetical protein